MTYSLPVGAAVRYFMQLMGQPTPDEPPQRDREALTWDRWGLRQTLIDEEYDELVKAYEEGDHAAFLDACVDMVYVIVGTAVEAGLPFDEAFDAVHRANMEKAPLCATCGGSGTVPVEGESWPEECDDCEGKGRIVNMRADGKVLKPVDWTPPNIKKIIEEAAGVEGV